MRSGTENEICFKEFIVTVYKVTLKGQQVGGDIWKPIVTLSHEQESYCIDILI